MSADAWRDCPKCGAVDQLREDYELFTDKDGRGYAVLKIEYGARCMAEDCNFHFTHSSQQSVKL